MDEFALLASFGPLAIYLLLLGVVLSMRKPFVTTAARDIAALGLGVSGMIFVGPVQLFFPSMSMANFGLWIWVMLAGFYLLTLSLIVLNVRPRIIVYGTRGVDLRRALVFAAKGIDPSSRQDADSVYLPSLGVRLLIASARGRSYGEVVLVSGILPQRQWDRLITELRIQLATAAPCGRVSGAMLIALALLFAALLGVVVVEAPTEIVDGFRMFIRL